MVAAFAAIGTKPTTGTTTVDVPYPASVGAGDMLVSGRGGWTAANSTMTTLSGWTKQGELDGGTGFAADSHTVLMAVDTKQAAGGESGNVTFSMGTAGGSIGLMARYTKDAAETWDLACVLGTDDTHAVNRSVTATASLDMAPGDIVIPIVLHDTDVSITITSPTLTASGITFGSANKRSPTSAGAPGGTDGNIDLYDFTVTSGSGTVTPTFAFTTATTQCGPIGILRLRAIPGPAGLTIIRRPLNGLLAR